MKFNSPIPRSGLPRFHESSPQRIPRDADATQRLWQKNRTQGQQLLANALAIEQLQRAVNRLRLRRGGESEGEDLPFQLYQGSSWLNIRVTTGPNITTGVDFEPSNPDTDLALTSGIEKNWVYISFSSASACAFEVSATVPTWDSSKIPLGTVDTTNTTDMVQDINQLWPFYIFNPCI